MWRRAFWYVDINVSEEFAFTTFQLLSILHPEHGDSPPPPKFLSMYRTTRIFTSLQTAVFIATAMRSPIPNQKPLNEKFKRQSQFVETHVPNNSKSDLKIILETFNHTRSVEFWHGLVYLWEYMPPACSYVIIFPAQSVNFLQYIFQIKWYRFISCQLLTVQLDWDIVVE